MAVKLTFWGFPFMIIAYVLMFYRIYQNPAMLLSWAGWGECSAYLLDSILIALLQLHLFTQYLERSRQEYHRYITSANNHLQVMKKKRRWLR